MVLLGSHKVGVCKSSRAVKIHLKHSAQSSAAPEYRNVSHQSGSPLHEKRRLPFQSPFAAADAISSRFDQRCTLQYGQKVPSFMLVWPLSFIDPLFRGRHALVSRSTRLLDPTTGMIFMHPPNHGSPNRRACTESPMMTLCQAWVSSMMKPRPRHVQVCPSCRSQTLQNNCAQLQGRTLYTNSKPSTSQTLCPKLDARPESPNPVSVLIWIQNLHFVVLRGLSGCHASARRLASRGSATIIGP